MLFSQWQAHVDPKIKIIPVELAGKGKRIQDLLYEDLEELISDVFNIIQKQIDGKYAVFGHSLGGLIAYELTQKLCKDPILLPEHIFSPCFVSSQNLV